MRKFVNCEICLRRVIVKENLSKICGKLVSRSFAGTFFRVFIVGAFYYARPTGQISVELIKGKWIDNLLVCMGLYVKGKNKVLCEMPFQYH